MRIINIHMRIHYALLGLLLMATAALAQPGPGRGPGSTDAPKASISGQVYDADLLVPVEYANVVLYSLRDSAEPVTGTVTHADGRFALTGLTPGRYRVEVSFIGYRTRIIDTLRLPPGSTRDLGRILLRQTAVAVEGTEITADKPRLEFRIDKKIINVAQNPAAQNGTAVDAIENAPGVKVDVENNVTLRGSSNFTVLIDGRPTLLEGSEALQQIPAGTIDNIEIITNPSAKYDPEGISGIINVVLRKQRQAGVSGIVNATAGLDDKYGGDILLNVRRSSASFLFGANFNRMNFPGTRTVESWTRDSAGDTRHANSFGSSLFGHRFYGLRAGTELMLGANDRLNLGGRWGGRNGGRSQSATYYEWSNQSGDTVVRDGYSNSGNGGDNLSANLDLTHSFGRSGHDLVLRFDYNRHDRISNDTTEMRDSTGAITTGLITTETGPRNRAGVKLDYALPLRNEGKFEAGYEGRFIWSRDRYGRYEYRVDADSYEHQPQFSHVSDFRYDVNALYSTWSGNLQGLGLQLGLRGEQTLRTITAPESTFAINQWDIFPGLHFSYKLPAEFQFMASYTRRVNRPRGWDLEPTESWMDAYNVRKGNPGLKNEYIDAVEGGFLWPFAGNRLSVEAYYRRTADVIDRVSSPYHGQPGVMLRTVANVGTNQSLGAELSCDISPLKWWNITITGDASRQDLDITLPGNAHRRSSFNWQAGVSNDFRLPTGTRVQLGADYDGPSVTTQGSDGDFFRTTIAVRQVLLNRALLLSLQVRDLLSTGGHTMKSEGEGFYTAVEFRRKTPVVTLGVTWNFNNYRPDRRQRNGGDEMDEPSEMEGF